MPVELVTFLTELAVNPEQQLAFLTSPEGVMQAVGLDEGSKRLLRTQDQAAVGRAFADALPQPSKWVYDPGPDPLPDPDPTPPPE